MSTNNSLAKYYRQFKTYVTLPSSSGDYVDNGVIEYIDGNKEIGVKPLTAYDEVMLKNPDALLNGEAVFNAITSCVPAVKNPRKLLINDTNFLLASIKKVSTEVHEIEIGCPKCAYINQYKLNLDNIINTVEFLDNTYPVNLNNGLTIFVSPYTYESTLQSSAIAFKEANFLRGMEHETTTEYEEQARVAQLSAIIKSITELNVDIVTSSILSIVNEDDEVLVTDKNEIRKYIKNIDSHEAEEISSEIGRISKIGLPQSIDMECQGVIETPNQPDVPCGHTWEAPLSFDPTTFFMDT